MNRTILFIDHDAGWSGSTVSMVYLLKAFGEAGYSVHVLTPKQESAASRLRGTGVSLLPLRNSRFSSIALSSHVFNTRNPYSWKIPLLLLHELWKILVGIVVVRRAIRQIRPQLVYVNEHVTMQASVAAGLCRIPAVIHVRSLLLKGYFGIVRHLLSRIILTFNQMIVAITSVEAEQLKARASERNKVRIVGEFFSSPDARTPGKNQCRDLLGLPRRKKVIAMLGGIEEIKGTVVFLRAATAIAEAASDVFFVVAGEHQSANARSRAYFDECMAVARPLKESGSLVILGHIADTMSLVNASDVIVSPSIVSHFSRPVIEAWGFGKPVVCSRTEHMQTLIDDGVNGLLFAAGDHEGLARCLRELLAHAGAAANLGREGKRKVSRDFRAEVNTRAIVHQCDILIAAREGGLAVPRTGQQRYDN